MRNLGLALYAEGPTDYYFLRPLHDGLPPLHGRGITYDAEHSTYMVTLRAYDKIKAQYKIKRETCLD